MLEKLKDLSNKLVDIFLVVLIIFSVLGSIGELTNSFFHLSSFGIEVLIVSYFLIVSLLFVSRKTKKIRKYIAIFLHENLNKILVILSIIIIAWQVYLAGTLVSTAVWEPAGMLERVIDPANASFPANAYFSNMPNNFLFFLIEKLLWIIFSKPNVSLFTFLLSLVNILMLDIAIYLMFVSLERLVNRRTGVIFLFLSAVLIGVSPWITIPYTDIWGFALSSMSFYTMLKLYDSKKTVSKVVLAVYLGVLLFVSYNLKASLVILYIAGMIVWTISLCSGKRNIKWGSVLIAIMSCLILSVSFSVYKNNNSLVEIDKTKAFPIMHYAAIGIVGTGSYNTRDAMADRAIKDPKKRQKRDVDAFTERLKSFGNAGNYARFLAQKQIYNSADGTFAWAYEGYTKLLYPKKNNIAQRLFFKEGYATKSERNSSFTFPIQIIWTVTLLLVLFTLLDSSLTVQIFKYSVVGFFMFLLLFEGGRSRYLIQFLPFLIALGSIGADKLIIKLKQIFYSNHFN